MARIDKKHQYDRAVESLEELKPLVNDTASLDDTASIELELLLNMAADYSEEHYSIGGNTSKQLDVYANKVLGV